VRALNEIDSRTANIEAKAAASSNGYKAVEDVRPTIVRTALGEMLISSTAGPSNRSTLRLFSSIAVNCKAAASSNGYKAVEDVRPLLADVKTKVSMLRSPKPA
jgi:hypothetical protein